jgi:hypothetical protein
VGKVRSASADRSTTGAVVSGKARLIGVCAAVLTALLGVVAEAWAQTAKEVTAARLTALDPGARLGANTIVGAGNGELLLGVPRTNFIVGLGSHETIVGGAGNDQLGALGANASINGGRGDDQIHGGPGNDVLEGGPGNDVIYGGNGQDTISGGPGDDEIIDTSGGATVNPGPGTNVVDVAGGQRSDHVLCAPGSTNLIYAQRRDVIQASCRRGAGSAVFFHAPPTQPIPSGAAVAARPVTGDGSQDNPFVAQCDFPQLVDCLVSAFPARRLQGFWSNELVPAYQCPADHPYLLNHDNAPPFGTAIPNGVVVENLGPVGVSIPVRTNASKYALGTRLGSATNWTFDPQSYRVALQCTSDIKNGWKFGSGTDL